MSKSFSVADYRRNAERPPQRRGRHRKKEPSKRHHQPRGLGAGRQIIVSAGLALMFFAVLVWPHNPADPTVLGPYLYIPSLLSGELLSLDLKTSTVSVLNGAIPSGIAALLNMVLLLAGLLAVFRHNWIIAATVILLLCAPWEFVGFAAQTGLMAVAVFAIAIPASFLPVSGLFKAAIALVAFTVFSFLSEIAPQSAALRIPGTDIAYQRAAYKDIHSDLVTTARWQQFLTNPDEVGDTDALAKARAFALTQERFRSGDAKGVIAAVDQIDGLGGAANKFERHVLNAIHQGLAMQGALGEQQQSRALSNYRYRVALSWLIFGIGLLLASAGPLSKLPRQAFDRRLFRMDAARRKLQTVAKVAAAVAGRTYATSSYQRQDSKAISSVAKANARDAIKTLTARFDEFAYTALTAFAISGVAYYLFRLFRLPDPGQNTAFHSVALPSGVARYGVDAGFVQAAMYKSDPLSLLLSVPLISIIIVFATVAAFFLFKSRVPALLLLLASMLLGLFAPHLVAPAPGYEVEASAIGNKHRSELMNKVILSGDPMTLALRPAINSADTALAPDGSRSGASDSNDISNSVSGIEAALVLAQIAYLESDPAGAARVLGSVNIEKRLAPPHQVHRLRVVRAWAEANGHATDVKLKSLVIGMPPTASRIVSHLFGTIAVGALSAGIALCVLCALVFRRRLSLLDMLDNAPSAARVAPDRLGRILSR